MRRWFGTLALMLALLMALGGLVSAEDLELGEAEPAPEEALAGAALPLDLSLALEGPGEAPFIGTPADGADAAGPSDNDGASLILNAKKLKLGVGERFALEPAVIPEGEASFRFLSTDTRIVEVSDTGEIVAVAQGKATVRVTAPGGLSAKCAVTVLAAPKSVQLNRQSVALGYDADRALGMTFRLKASLPSGSASQVTFTSDDTSVVRVDAGGLLTAAGVGVASVRAKTFNGKEAVAAVTVLPAPDAVALSEEALTMIPGERHTLAASLPEDTFGPVTFTSDNAAVAQVNARTGRITAVALGEATVTAACFNGVSASCAVKVVAKPARIALSADRLSIGLGEDRPLEAVALAEDGSPSDVTLRFSSSKPKVASVSADGVVTGNAKGAAKITVTAGGVKAACTVKVVGAPGSIRVQAGKPRLTYDPATGKGDSTGLAVTLPSGTASAIAFLGYDPDILEVSAEGVVTAVGTGVTRVTASTFNGKTASCVIRVRSAYEDCMVNVAHRGGSGYWPENTLEAFRNTESTGATAVELDARTTKDGVQVVHHDPYFKSGGRKQYIDKLTLSQLKQKKPSICTLDEALDVIAATGLELDLELKDTADPEACVASVRRHNLQGRTVYISFEQSLLKKVRRLEPSARLGYIIKETPSGLDEIVSGLDAFYIAQKSDYLTAANLLRWQNSGLLVGVWTVDDASEIRRWMDMGVDYLTSNYPRRVSEALGH